MKLILPLGYHCNITFICKGLNIKKETGLFEYLECARLDDINTIILLLINMRLEGNANYSKMLKYSGSELVKHRINILTPQVFTCHYKPIEYKEIFVRRVERFFNRIESNTELIFSRINILNKTTSVKAITKFYSLIKQINPDISITFLLIDTILDANSFQPLVIDNLPKFRFQHKYFLYSDYDDDVYFKTNEKIWNQFYNYIKELGFVKDEEINYEFTDKDI